MRKSTLQHFRRGGGELPPLPMPAVTHDNLRARHARGAGIFLTACVRVCVCLYMMAQKLKKLLIRNWYHML